jgi:hypothetical protein
MVTRGTSLLPQWRPVFWRGPAVALVLRTIGYGSLYIAVVVLVKSAQLHRGPFFGAVPLFLWLTLRPCC